MEDRWHMSMEGEEKIVIALLTDDVTAAFECPLVVEIDILPESMIIKMSVTSEWCKLGKKCVWNTYDKSWSDYCLVA